MAINEGWKRTVDGGLTDPAWDYYDQLIVSETNGYNTRLRMTKGFVLLDWKNFKAMAWVETGASNAAWKTRPMQIGNPGDDGLITLQKGLQTAPLIMSTQLQADVSMPGRIDDPTVNIQAGIAYMLVCLTKSDIGSVDDPKDTAIYHYKIAPGDSFSSLAKKLGTTVVSLQQLNGNSPMLRPKQDIRYRKASMQRVITGWSSDFVNVAATKYNNPQKGDPAYAEKLNYVLSLFPKLVRGKK